MTDDPEPEVNQAAVSALNQMALRRETKLLAQQALDANNEFDRWLYLDSLLNFADQGDECSQWPVEGPLVCSVLSPLQLLKVKETVKRRRYALAKKQESDDRIAFN